MKPFSLKVASILTGVLILSAPLVAKPVEILNVSYDPTREFYKEYNEQFSTFWKSRTGQPVDIKQSHGGSGKQARAVIDGLGADVVTLALPLDIDAIAERTSLISKDWSKKFTNRSTPYYSTIVFLVRKGNPKKIRDWSDLARPGIAVITPNPKTSGGAKYNFLAAWQYGIERFKSTQKTMSFVTAIFKNVPVLDSGARGSTTTFVERGIGDVLITWENEGWLIVDKLGKGQFELVYPSLSVLAEPPVAVVEGNAKKHGTLEVSKAYIQHLYSQEGQTLAAKYYYRPSDKAILKKFSKQFKSIPLFTIDQKLGGFAKVNKVFFDDGGVFDRIYQSK